MNNKDRQIYLETKMYKRNSFGKEPYCRKCWAKTYTGCMGAIYRSSQLSCVKAECRLNGCPFELREIIEPPSALYSTYGFKK